MMLPFDPVPQGSKPLVWREQVDRVADQIMTFFQDNLPSNYVSTVDGPQYRMHWRNLAVALATIQVQALEVLADQTEQTRGEYIQQLWGKILLPAGVPSLDSDQALRDFLNALAPILLRGASREAIEQAVQLLANATVSEAEDHTFEITIEGLSANPVQLEQNVRLLVDALRPAHTVYRLRHLIRDTVAQPVDTVPRPDSRLTTTLVHDVYDDSRVYWAGVESIGSTGTVTGRWLNDVKTDLSSVLVGAPVEIDGSVYRVVSVRRFRQEDSVPRAFTTTGTQGFVTLDGDWLTSDVDLVHANWGDTLTIESGPNAGGYRLEYLDTGPLGGQSGYRTRPTVGWLELDRPAPTGLLTYRVGIDRKGRATATHVVEDVTSQFAT